MLLSLKLQGLRRHFQLIAAAGSDPGQPHQANAFRPQNSIHQKDGPTSSGEQESGGAANHQTVQQPNGPGLTRAATQEYPADAGASLPEAKAYGFDFGPCVLDLQKDTVPQQVPEADAGRPRRHLAQRPQTGAS